MVQTLRTVTVGLVLLLVTAVGGPAAAQEFNGSDARVGIQAGADNGVTVSVVDESDMMTYNEEYVISNLTTNIAFPPSVKNVTYMLFRTNNSDLLLDVRAANDRLDLGIMEYDATATSAGALAFTPGNLIVAVGLNPGVQGIYAHPQVRDELQLSDTSHLRGARQAMKQYLRDDRWSGALLAGARAAADPTVTSTRRPVWFIVLIAWAIIALLIGVIYLISRTRRFDAVSIKQDTKWLEKTYPLAVANYEQANLQFNAVNSPLKNQQVTAQWQEISQKMRDLAHELDALTPLDKDASEDDVARRAGILSVMRNTLEGYNTAVLNIEELYGFETGDLSRRKRIINWLLGDITRTAREDPAEGYTELIAQVKQLSPDDDEFIDTYVELTRAYGQLRVRPTAQATTPAHTPALWDAGWHPGMTFIYRAVWGKP